MADNTEYQTLTMLIKSIEMKLDQIQLGVDSNDRAIRGKNGDIGLVGQVSKLKDAISSHEDQIQRLSVKLDSVYTMLQKYEHFDFKDAIKEATDEDHVVRWSVIREKTFWPLVFIVLIGLLYLLKLEVFSK